MCVSSLAARGPCYCIVNGRTSFISSGDRKRLIAPRGKLGPIAATRNAMPLGWDTALSPTDPALSTYIMKRVLERVPRRGGPRVGGESTRAE